jgi:uncharacterized membrane protein YoaK (UPF0700 family)
VPDGNIAAVQPPGLRSLHVGLLGLTFVTGLVDAVTYLSFGHVFAANMTGNVIVLGFALAGAGDISVTASLASFTSFMLGGIISARLARALERTRHRWILSMLVIETVLLSVAAALSVSPLRSGGSHLIVGLLAVAMGMRTVSVRRLGISDISTTVLTTMLAALATDTQLPGTTLFAAGLRAAAVMTMLLGAVSGALLSAGGPGQSLWVAVALVLSLTLSYAAALLGKRSVE